MKVILKDEYSPFFGECPKCGIKMELHYTPFHCPYCSTELEIDEKEYEKICGRFIDDSEQLPF